MKKILPWVSVNGKILPQEKATISIFDNGFLYGDGFFTTLKVREGTPLFFEKHLQRLQISAKQLSFPSHALSFNLKKSLQNIIKRNSIQDGGIRITVTRGNSSGVSGPTVIIHASTIEDEIQQVSVVTVTDERDQYKTLKMTYRVPHIIALQKARLQGTQDALFLKNNYLIESTYANIYSYTSDDKIITPPMKQKGLNGVYRQILLEQLPIQEREIPRDTREPVLLISSLSTRIVEKIDGRQLKQNKKFVTIMRKTLDNAEKEYIAAQKNEDTHY